MKRKGVSLSPSLYLSISFFLYISPPLLPPLESAKHIFEEIKGFLP